MRANLTLTAVAVLASLTGALQAATYAVDPVKGNDSNPGTSKQPWKTMAPVNREYAKAVYPCIFILNKFLMNNENGGSLNSASNAFIQGNTFSYGTPREEVRQNNCTIVTEK